MMSIESFLEFIVYAFATFCIAQYVGLEFREGFPVPVWRDGRIRWATHGILRQIRLWAKAEGDMDENGDPKTALGRLFACPACLMPFSGLLLLPFYLYLPQVLMFIGMIGLGVFLHDRGYNA